MNKDLIDYTISKINREKDEQIKILERLLEELQNYVGRIDKGDSALWFQVDKCNFKDKVGCLNFQINDSNQEFITFNNDTYMYYCQGCGEYICEDHWNYCLSCNVKDCDKNCLMQDYKSLEDFEDREFCPECVLSGIFTDF